MYDVLKSFRDSHDRNLNYKKGDTFPREGLEVGDRRIQTLKDLGYISGRRNVEALEQPTLDWKKADIQEYLDDAGIEYNASDTKADLLDLLED